MRKTILPIFVSTLWISISEFVRNTFLVHKHWLDHYASLGIVFPEQTVNGGVWGIWSLCFAILIFILGTKFSIWQTTFISWFAGFVLMWLVIGNMGVLPFSILTLAIPLSFLESLVAAFIFKKLGN